MRFRYDDTQKSTWWLKDESLVPVARSILAAVDKCPESSSPDNFQILKQTHDRLILRVLPQNFASQSFIAKIFILSCLRHKLKYHIKKYDRFGFAEAANLIIAAQRGLNVPRIYGYGRIYGSLALIKKSIVLLEDLAHQATVGKLLELNSRDQNKCADILGRTIPVFAGLYKANCNHIDVNPESILLDDEDLKQRVFLLDFEYARFYDRPSLEILMFEAAHFAKACSGWLKEDTINNWVANLLDAIEVRDALSREKTIRRFNYYYFGIRLSRRERIKIH